jgi:hypothetical protein
VLEPFRIHIAKFWKPELIDKIEADHRDLPSHYVSDQVLRGRHRPSRQHYVIRVGVGLRLKPIRSSARVLWGLGDRFCQHDVCRERLFHPQVGDGRIPHLVDASIAGGRVSIEADGPSAVRMHVIQHSALLFALNWYLMNLFCRYLQTNETRVYN